MLLKKIKKLKKKRKDRHGESVMNLKFCNYHKLYFLSINKMKFKQIEQDSAKIYLLGCKIHPNSLKTRSLYKFTNLVIALTMLEMYLSNKF